MPQFDLSYYPSQVFWLAISFGLLFLILRGVVLPKIGSSIQSRHDRIANDMDAADSLSARAEEMADLCRRELDAARQAAVRLMDQIEKDIEKRVEERLVAAQAEYERLLEEKEKEIAREMEALSVPRLAARGAQLMVARLTGESCEEDRFLDLCVAHYRSRPRGPEADQVR